MAQMVDARPRLRPGGADIRIAPVGQPAVEEKANRIQSGPLRPAHGGGVAVGDGQILLAFDGDRV